MEILYITDGCLGDTYKVVPPSDVCLFIIPIVTIDITPIHQPKREIGLICTKLANYNNRSDPSY